MIPDPEREQAVRERLSVLFADAPQPDPLRLADGLQAASARRRGRQRRRRAIAWLAVACLVAAGTATAVWIAESGREESAAEPVPFDGADQAAAEERPAGTAPESAAPGDGDPGDGDPGDGDPGSRDGPVIYQRSN